jgi:excisionase family DNA binding protein
MPDSELLTAEEVAPMLRLSVESVRRLIREKRIAAVKIGRRYLIAPAEIERIKAEGTAPVVLAGGRVFQPGDGGSK